MTALTGLRKLESTVSALEKHLILSRRFIHVFEMHQDNEESFKRLRDAMLSDGRAEEGDIFVRILDWGDDPIFEARLLYSKESL